MKPACIPFVVVVLSGCALSPQALSAPPPALAALREIEVRNIVWQDELDFADADRVFANGVATARENEYRRREVHRAMLAMLPAFEDVDVRRQLEQALERGVREGMPAASVRVITTARVPERADMARLRAGLQPGTAFMDVRTEYALSINQRIEMRTTAALYQAGRDEPVYANRFYYQSPAVIGGFEIYAVWTADNGEKYRQAIAEGVDEIGRMITLDLASGAASAGTAKQMTLPMLNGSKLAPDVTGAVLQERPGRVVLRADSGGLYSFAR